MTKQKAVLLALKIIDECNMHSEENGSCRGCPFSMNGASCMVSEGNDIPHNWNIKDKLRELIEK